ncbi:MAG: IS66 family insertion sequence element accessory protein TnpB [Bacillota bacterium]
MTKDEREANRAAWAERITEFRASGLSAPQWCAAHGLKIHQIRYWLKKLETPAPGQTAVRWLPVDFSDPESVLTVRVGAAAIEVRTGFDPQLFMEVVRTLSAL